ncbi:MAG: capsule assembly Wzi family protein, partial [Treponema sp.]|nr:capsule assembly Wzi family protein [Treponema sp.]
MPKTRETVKKRFFLTALLIVCFFLYPAALFAQEALESFEEEYYDFLSLQGLTKRPALNYRTLSDSAWNIAADNENGETPPHPWQNLNLGTKRRLFGEAAFRVYGPELFMSGNTAAPYGQNDGALWQGRGFNASFTGGVRFEGYGVELAFKPRLSFSQNAAFEYITPNYSGAIFAGKAETYGYYGIQGIDAPQRFGDEPFFAWDWGDSEARYTWKTLTVGFGTQAIWLGPAQINPIIHSNNAPSYPKLDFGLRRQRITLPWLGWHIGDIEARTWWGYLSESAWFD